MWNEMTFWCLNNTQVKGQTALTWWILEGGGRREQHGVQDDGHAAASGGGHGLWTCMYFHRFQQSFLWFLLFVCLQVYSFFSIFPYKKKGGKRENQFLCGVVDCAETKEPFYHFPADLSIISSLSCTHAYFGWKSESMRENNGRKRGKVNCCQNPLHNLHHHITTFDFFSTLTFLPFSFSSYPLLFLPRSLDLTSWCLSMYLSACQH